VADHDILAAGAVAKGQPMSDAGLDTDLELLLDHLRCSRGFDFTGYKRSSLSRRVERRMRTVGVESYLSYRDYLEVVPAEFTNLFNTILINVTSFFRDPPVWNYVAEEILPRLLAHLRPDEPLRIWSAGCASGEEAYTLAMLCAEQLGMEQCRERLKIYATDLDEDALIHARAASYGAKAVENVPPDLLERYFERNGQGSYLFSKELRRTAIFGRHDLIQDAPISRVDLLVCRNTLMYLNADTQAHILARFSFALRRRGYLLLGKAELLPAHSSLFTSVDLKSRVFRPFPQGALGERLMLSAGAAGQGTGDPVGPGERLRGAAFEASPEGQLVVDAAGRLGFANAKARALFNLDGDDIGKPFQDLEISYRPVELRSRIQQVYAERRPATVCEVEWPGPGGEMAYLEVQVTPLLDNNQILLGASVSFANVTLSRRFQHELERANRGLEDAYEELQSTNEELETTNEELQSTVEELETTNEELQSTNEELETMNEELHATNEELKALNDVLSQRTTKLNQMNALLESIWASLGRAVAVLDTELRVAVWNHRSQDLWGLRPEEAQGQHFANLDIGLPVERLLPALRATISGEDNHRTTLVQATNRRGQTIHCRVTCSPLLGSDDQIHGAILVTEDEPTDDAGST